MGEEERRYRNFWSHKEAFAVLWMRTNENLNSRGAEKEDAVENLSRVGLSERPTLDVFAYRGFKVETERKGKYH